MTDDQFNTMVDRLEKVARSKPRLYRARVAMLAVLGYGYYGFLLLLVAVVGVVVVMSCITVYENGRVSGGALKLILIGTAFFFSMGYILIRSLFVRLEPPEGIELPRAEVPELFNMLDELRLRLDLPDLKKVLLTDEFNASVVQVPRYFFAGPTDHYLVLGYPLMDSLTPAQFKSVLGHEFGHLSGNHGAFSNWIYRIRAMYGRLYESLQGGEQSDFLVRGFLKRYVPYFDAYSYVLARDNEYDADKTAADMTSKEDTARALVTIHALGRYLSNEYWPGVYKSATANAAPPAEILPAIRKHWSQNFSSTAAANCIEADFNCQASPYNTHPSLSARLLSLGFEADQPQKVEPLFELPGAETESAAQALFADKAGGFAHQASEMWIGKVSEYWKHMHQDGQESQKRIESLNAAADRIGVDELVEKAAHLRRLDQLNEAEALFRQALELEPEHEVASTMLGLLLLEKKDEAGLEFLMRLNEESDPDAISASAEAIASYFDVIGRGKEAENLLVRFREVYVAAATRTNERQTLDKKTTYLPHGIAEADLDKLIGELESSPLVLNAWVVRKDVPGKPFYVIMLERKKPLIELTGKKSLQEFVETTKLQIPGSGTSGTVLLVDNDNKWVLKRLKKVEGSHIFDRKKSVAAKVAAVPEAPVN